MTKDIASFEQELQDLFLAGVDDEFAAWVQEAAAELPVDWDSIGEAADVVGYLKMGLIMMSGYQKERYDELAGASVKMKEQELASGRWDDLGGNEAAAARKIALVAFTDIAGVGSTPSVSFTVCMMISLFCFAVSLRSYQGDPESFRRLFVLAWIEYFFALPFRLSAQESEAKPEEKS